MRRSHNIQTQSTAFHCRLTSPTGEWLFTDAQYALLWLAAKLHQGHVTDSRDIQNGWILSGLASEAELREQTPVMFIKCHLFIPHSNDTTVTFLGWLLSYFRIVYRHLNFSSMTDETARMLQEVSVVSFYVTTFVCPRENKESLDKLLSKINN